MRMKRMTTLYGGVAVLLVLLTWAVLVQSTKAQRRSAQPEPPPVLPIAERPVVPSVAAGRFIIVTPAAELPRNTFMLDTATGRAWVVCSQDAQPYVNLGWCEMRRSNL